MAEPKTTESLIQKLQKKDIFTDTSRAEVLKQIFNEVPQEDLQKIDQLFS